MAVSLKDTLWMLLSDLQIALLQDRNNERLRADLANLTRIIKELGDNEN